MEHILQPSYKVQHHDPSMPRKAAVGATTDSRPDDFNSRGNVVALLKAHNWTINKGASNDANIRFTRPGKNGQLCRFENKRIGFYVFTSNSQFQPMRAYNPAQVFAVLECGGDFSIAYRQLLAMGYGEPPRGSWVSNNTFNSESGVS